MSPLYFSPPILKATGASLGFLSSAASPIKDTAQQLAAVVVRNCEHGCFTGQELIDLELCSQNVWC